MHPKQRRDASRTESTKERRKQKIKKQTQPNLVPLTISVWPARKNSSWELAAPQENDKGDDEEEAAEGAAAADEAEPEEEAVAEETDEDDEEGSLMKTAIM
jgi:hypothetical protein